MASQASDGAVWTHGSDNVEVNESSQPDNGTEVTATNSEEDNAGVASSGLIDQAKEGDTAKCIGCTVLTNASEGTTGCATDLSGNFTDGKGETMGEVRETLSECKVLGATPCQFANELPQIGTKVADVTTLTGCGQCESTTGDCQIGKILTVTDMTTNQCGNHEVGNLAHRTHAVTGQKGLIAVLSANMP